MTQLALEALETPRLHWCSVGTGANIRPNAKLTFVEEGGEAQVNRVAITAIVPGLRPLEPRQTYLCR